MINKTSLKNMAAMTDTMPVIIEDRDTYFEIYKVSKKDKIITKKSKGLTPKIIPPDVATAFPPLNFAKTGYVWPMTANNPKMTR